MSDRFTRTHWIVDCLLVMGGALALLLPVLGNRFPFVFSMDTIDYIILTPRLYRSPFYQIFIFLTGLKRSIWAPVVVQALLSSAALFILLRSFAMASAARFALIITTLTLFSSLAIFVGFLMPDIFTGLLFLSQFLLVFRWTRLSRADRFVCAALLLLATAVHLSHLTMAIAMLFACIALKLIWRRGPVAVPGLVVAGMTTICVMTATLAYDRAVFKTWSLAPAGQTFLLANLLAYGPARAELREQCPQAGYRLCAHLDELPASANAFLWNGGVLAELGGFAGMREESGRIVNATLRHRSGEVASVSVHNSLRAVERIRPAVDIEPFPRWRDLADVFAHYSPSTATAFEAGLQQRGLYPVAPWNIATQLGFVVALLSLTVLTVVALRGGRADILIFPAFALAAFVGNAMTCATLSGVSDRYQSRVSWLVVLSALIAWMEWRRSSLISPGGKLPSADSTGIPDRSTELADGVLQ